MLGASDRPDDLGLDFLIQCNPFVKSENIDAEHLVRRALLGNSHTVVSITPQKDTSVELMLEKYAAAGLTFGTPFQDAVPELGIPEKGYKCESRVIARPRSFFDDERTLTSYARPTILPNPGLQTGSPTKAGPSGACRATASAT